MRFDSRGQRLALAGLGTLGLVFLAGHSRLGAGLPVNLASENAHLGFALVAVALAALVAAPPLGRLVREGGPGGESLFASFRRAHPLLKLSLSVVLLLALALAVEAASWLVLRVWVGQGGPLFRQRLSGYRVFAEQPERGDASVIGEPGATHVTDAWGFTCDHPVSLEKPAGTVRIFLTGGSALAGSGQVGSIYARVHPYPQGVYSYAASVAGALRDSLRAKRPDLAVEVVNAAYYQKCFHQSLVHYLETLSRFHPDYVVNVDGYNDQDYFWRDDPQQDTWAAWEARFLDPTADLRAQELGKDGHSNARRLATLLFQKAGVYGPKGATPGAPRSDEQVRRDYEALRERAVRGSRRWLETYGHYLAVLGGDGVRLVFSVQPLLSRSRGNKTLSAVERGFDALVVPPADAKEGSHEVEGFAIARHFLDDHLSAELRRRTEARGQVYVDLGEEIRGLGADVELYTDYCHLTPEGNRVVGRRLAEAVDADLATRGLPR